MYLQSGLYQRCRHIVLCGKRVGSRHVHFCTACRQHLAQICGFGFQMHRKGHLLACEGFCLTEFFFQHTKQVTVSLYPLDFLLAGSGQVNVSDFATHY